MGLSLDKAMMTSCRLSIVTICSSLAAIFRRDYNLPVYFHYNHTFRRAYLAMLRCRQIGSDATESVATISRPAVVTRSPRRTSEQCDTVNVTVFLLSKKT